MNEALSTLAREISLADAEHAPTEFEPEFTWQVEELRRLAQAHRCRPEQQ